MLASLELEREPLTLTSIFSGGGLEGWVQTVGVIFGLGVLIFMIARLCGWRPQIEKQPPRWMPIFWLFGISMLLVYTVAIIVGLVILGGKGEVASWLVSTLRVCITLGGVLALIAATMDYWIGVTRLRWRRVWALAMLSIKEAIRAKILYVFSVILGVFLFASWFLPSKPEDQLKNLVAIVFYLLPLLVLISSGLVSAFSIPNDIRNQNIHTIVTKPVERFEIVLGRFIGYTILMSAVLYVLTIFSLVMVLRGVQNNDVAQRESLKARKALYGTLAYESVNEVGERRPLNPENVGREWDYRGYVGGPQRGRPTQYAVWSFEKVPESLGKRDLVKLEFYLDIYRTTKGEENRGVNCTFLFETWRSRPSTAQEYTRDERRFQPTKRDELVEEYGYFEVQSKQIFDYQTKDLEVPGALFRSQNITRAELQALITKYEGRVAALKKQRDELTEQIEPLRRKQRETALATAAGVSLFLGLAPDSVTNDELDTIDALEIKHSKLERDLAVAEDQLKYSREDDKSLEGWEKDGKPRPPLKVRVRCNTPNQFVGMAKYDLYFRVDNADVSTSEWAARVAFTENFYKGAAGIWLRMVLVIGLCVFLSTELGGIISVLCTGILYIGGWPGVREFIEELAVGKNVGGGPLEAFFRIAKRENISAPLEESTTTKVATTSDDVFRWILRRFMYILPDIGRFDFSEHVGKGFDIAVWEQDLFPAFIMLIGYLFPWSVVAYYLIKIREIAGAH